MAAICLGLNLLKLTTDFIYPSSISFPVVGMIDAC